MHKLDAFVHRLIQIILGTTTLKVVDENIRNGKARKTSYDMPDTRSHIITVRQCRFIRNIVSSPVDHLLKQLFISWYNH